MLPIHAIVVDLHVEALPQWEHLKPFIMSTIRHLWYACMTINSSMTDTECPIEVNWD